MQPYTHKVCCTDKRGGGPTVRCFSLEEAEDTAKNMRRLTINGRKVYVLVEVMSIHD